MSDLLFKCGKCSKSLAVDSSRVGATFSCPNCRNAITVPVPAMYFPCSRCNAELCTVDALREADFECPTCESMIVIPRYNKLTCPSCSVHVELEDAMFEAVEGTTLDCPRCGKRIPVPSTGARGRATRLVPPVGSGTPKQVHIAKGASPQSFHPPGYPRARPKRRAVKGVVRARGQAASDRRCPFCAEAIQAEAVKCKHCGTMLGKENP